MGAQARCSAHKARGIRDLSTLAHPCLFIPAEREREAALRAQLAAAAAEPAEAAAQREAAEQQQLVRSMQAVMAGVKQYQFEVYQNPEVGAEW